MTDINDMFDERLTGTSEYPDWWEPEGEGERIQGRVADMRGDPWAEEEDREPAWILEVHTDDGEVYSTRPHSVLDQLIKQEGVEEGDFVRIEFQGKYRTNNGNMANNYKLAVVKANEVEEVGTDGGVTTESPSAETPEPEEDDVPLLVDPNDHTVAELETKIGEIEDPDVLEQIREAEEAGGDRKSVYDLIDRQIGEDESSADGDDSEADSSDDDSDLSEAAEFAENIISYHDNELEVSELDKFLNDVRGFGVEVEDVVDELGATIEDDIVSQ